MKVFNLSAELRHELGKKATKALRVANKVPGNLYGSGENINIVFRQEDVRKLIYTPEIFSIDLQIEGKMHKAVVKELQFDPVTDRLLHIDFLEVSEEKPIEMEVPVVLQGHAEGVKAGGKLSLEMRKLRVKAVYTQIPEKLFIDVTNLGLGKTIQVGALHFDGLEVMNAKNAVVCAVKLTRAARGAMTKK